MSIPNKTNSNDNSNHNDYTENYKKMITAEILQLHIVAVILSGREVGGRRRLTIVIMIIAMAYKTIVLVAI